MFRPLFCENCSPLQCSGFVCETSSPLQCGCEMSWKSVKKCEISRKSVPENGLQIEDRKSRKSKVAKYSKILADLPSEQIFTEITHWVPLGFH